MLTAISLALAALSSTTLAAPTTTSSSVYSPSLSAAVSKLGATLQTNAAAHGPRFAAAELTVPKGGGVSHATHKHSIAWPKQEKGCYIDWRKWKGNGVNLGAWLEQEQNFDVPWWAANIGEYPDEWTWCAAVGFKVCGPALEARFASYVTTADIDKLGSLGVNTLRIPTTYAAWVDVPGSKLYHGKQKQYIRKIANYAIEKYSMHIILGLHSLPGGINSLQIGEAFGHDDWFFNVTNLDYSFQAVESILDFIKTSGQPWAYTIAPGNEFNDNLTAFATPAGLTDDGVNWMNTFVGGVLNRIGRVDKRIPLMLQDAFQSESFWSPFYDAGTNLVIDSHIYFFAITSAPDIPSILCGQQIKKLTVGDGKFPVFIGEYSLQAVDHNTLSYRKVLYDTQSYTYSKHASGSSFWNIKMANTVDPVIGPEGRNGTLQDYWNWESLAAAGIVSIGGVGRSGC